MSKLSETLDTLIFEKGLTYDNFAKEVDIAACCISAYMHENHMPSVENLVKIADYFNCSTDFLLGFEEENKNLTFKPCPPFSERLKFLKQYYNCKSNYFYTNTGITKSRFFEWQNGTRMPLVDNVVKIAKLFDCRIDFVLGRES